MPQVTISTVLLLYFQVDQNYFYSTALYFKFNDSIRIKHDNRKHVLTGKYEKLSDYLTYHFVLRFKISKTLCMLCDYS